MATAINKTQRDRSPSYPFISLKSAIDRLIAFDEYFGRHAAPANKVGLAWGMKEKSSQSFQTLAALKSFGLVVYDGSGDARMALLSADARTYLRAQQQSIKQEALERCALNPKAIRKYWDVWGADRPRDPICLDELTLRDGFTDDAARTFLSVYDATIAYAGLSKSDKVDGDEVLGSDDEGNIEEGDLIQWEPDGVLQFSTPKRVRATQEHEGKWWVFVDGSETGIPMTEVNLEQKGSGRSSSMASTPPILHEDKAMAEREWLRGPLSRQTSYRLIVSGDVGATELGKLIKLLEAQKEVLADDKDD